jgi:hypothetical protein
MAESDRSVGSGASIVFDGNTLHTDYQSAAFDRSLDTVENSAGNQTSKTYIPTLKDGTGQVTLAWAGTNAPSVALGDEGSFVYGPNGSTSGQPRRTVNAILNSVSIPVEFAGLTTQILGFQFNGDVTEDTYP